MGYKGEPQSHQSLARIIVRCPVLVAQAYVFSLLAKQPLSHLEKGL